MLKSPMPMCFYSIALIVATPTAANPDRSSASEATVITDSGILDPHFHYTKMSFAHPDKKGMRFVNNYIRKNDESLAVVKLRSEMAFTVIDSVLTLYRLPLELKYLAVIESELKPTAVSRVGAKGTWQLMRGTAHELGLKVNRHTDERKDLAKSTSAAAKYLRDLHREFGDWLLVLAAYNGGPAPVYRAIRQAHSRNFWVLQRYLPVESRLHVKKFIATAYYFERDTEEPKPEETAFSRVIDKPSMPEASEKKFRWLMQESAQSLRVSNEPIEEED